jgi:glc operon protein GlcG
MQVICAALVAQGKAAVVAVADSHGELLGLLRIGDVALTSIPIAMNKAYTAARSRGPTGDIGRAVRHPEQGFDILYFGDARFIGWDGGIPIQVAGQTLGAIAVSGLSGEEDVALAELGRDAILGAP